MSSLEWRGVSVRYAARRAAARAEQATEPPPAVDEVSLSIGSGETVGLAGESGCGKSTLAATALRLLPRGATVTGKVLLDGEDVAGMNWGRVRAVRWTAAAIVFQGAMHSLNPVRRIRWQIAEALELHGDPRWSTPAARHQRVGELLRQVDLPTDRADAYPHELSGGQKQRVMIAMALACDPDIIIADEPTTALDVVVQAQVLQVLSELVAERGLTLVMISHDLSVLAQTCERLVVMRHGRIVEEGPAAEVVAHPQHEHTRELAAAFPRIGDPHSRFRVGRAARESEFDPELVARENERELGAELLQVRDLVVDFRARGQRVRAVDRVSLSCRQGEIVALVGQSGSGKTTLARSVLGLQRPTSGVIHYAGQPIPRGTAAARAYRRKVQFVLQDPSGALNPKQSVFDAVAEGPRVHRLGELRERVLRALTAAELTPPEEFLDALPQELSGGQRQRVVIAGALALDPEYLVADEPVASLDASVRGEILGLLLRLRRELGLGALVITHDLGLAWNIADRVLVMRRGRIVEDGPVEKVLLDPQDDYTKSLLSAAPRGLRAAG